MRNRDKQSKKHFILIIYILIVLFTFAFLIYKDLDTFTVILTIFTLFSIIGFKLKFEECLL